MPRTRGIDDSTCANQFRRPGVVVVVVRLDAAGSNLKLDRSIYRAQRGILCGLLLCRCRRSRSLVAAAGSLDPLSVASSASICCCRQSSLQNGVSPLHIHARARAPINNQNDGSSQIYHFW